MRYFHLVEIVCWVVLLFGRSAVYGLFLSIASQEAARSLLLPDINKWLTPNYAVMIFNWRHSL